MAESPQFETLVQSLSSTLQSLEQKRKELKKQGHSTGIWVGGIILVIGIAFSLYANAALIGIGIAAGLALLLAVLRNKYLLSVGIQTERRYF